MKTTPGGVQSVFATVDCDSFPEGLAFDSGGNIFVNVLHDNPPNGPPSVTIYKFTPDGVQSTFASPPGAQGFGLAFDSAGNLYTAVDFQTEASQIWKYMPDGTPSLFATATDSVSAWTDLAFDRFGNLFVSDDFTPPTPSKILKFTPDGEESDFATDLAGPRGLAFDSAGNLFVADLPAGEILKFTPHGSKTVFASGIPTPEFLAFPKLPGPPGSTTINFDAIDASANPVGGTTLQNYLGQYGITVSNVTLGSQVVVDDDRRVYDGGVVFASSPYNFLSDYFLNAPNSFTLSFSRPADSINFTRIAGGPFPTLYASWTATALIASGQVLSSVSEFSPGVANFPAKMFTLNGPRITKVRFDSDGFGIAAFSAVLLDDLVLNYGTPRPR